MEPTGPLEDDPNVTDRKFPGNPSRSYRTREPVRIVGEVQGWERLPPQVLEKLRERQRRPPGSAWRRSTTRNTRKPPANAGGRKSSKTRISWNRHAFGRACSAYLTHPRGCSQALFGMRPALAAGLVRRLRGTRLSMARAPSGRRVRMPGRRLRQLLPASFGPLAIWFSLLKIRIPSERRSRGLGKSSSVSCPSIAVLRRAALLFRAPGRGISCISAAFPAVRKEPSPFPLSGAFSPEMLPLKSLFFVFIGKGLIEFIGQ